MVEFSVGSVARKERLITEQDIAFFAELSGDFSPIHMDEEYAKNTRFKGRIAHGMMTAGFISAVLGTQLPGEGTIYLSQSLKFLAPVRIGETVVVEVEVLEIDTEKRRARLKTTGRTEQAGMVVEGEALVMYPKRG
ncbi:MAG: MaoC family dehydratase [Firmicutes bacterium]|nr:MaoC family dehydratase [Dethiobacter sp.]MBS3889666.1 MaoC family dehydratase [Bacillota bacterium]MBS4054652.1 MaoC family dehydratase [Thermaerobacter sp.]